MVTMKTSHRSFEELIIELAEAGLRNHIRPIGPGNSGISCRLFDLDADCERKSRALAMLEAAYHGTPASELGPHDARIFRRERERRVKQLNAMIDGRSKLLAHYGRELLDSPLRHPSLTDQYEALTV